MRNRSLRITALCFLLAVTVCPGLNAQLPRIRLNSVFPSGGKAGTKLSVTIAGDLSDAATELVFSAPDIQGLSLIHI